MCMVFKNCKRRVCESCGHVASTFVIPGRREAASPESITTVGSMDSGLAPRGAPRNDEWRELSEGRILSSRHLAADFGAQLVDQTQALLGLDMPERPAVAGFRALRHRADAVDR